RETNVAHDGEPVPLKLGLARPRIARAREEPEWLHRFGCPRASTWGPRRRVNFVRPVPMRLAARPRQRRSHRAVGRRLVAPKWWAQFCVAPLIEPRHLLARSAPLTLLNALGHLNRRLIRTAHLRMRPGPGAPVWCWPVACRAACRSRRVYWECAHPRNRGRVSNHRFQPGRTAPIAIVRDDPHPAFVPPHPRRDWHSMWLPTVNTPRLHPRTPLRSRSGQQWAGW